MDSVSMYLKRKEQFVLLLLYLSGIMLYLGFTVAMPGQEAHFAYLAKSFLHGHLYLGPTSSRWLDASYYKGYAYWPQGIFPALVLLPFYLLHMWIQQGEIQFVLNMLNLFLLYKIAVKITNNKTTALWLSFAYIFSTAYIAVGAIPWSWYFAQVTATTALLLSLYEYVYKKRWFLIGIYIACAVLTRIDLIFAFVFFFGLLMETKKQTREKIYDFVNICIPIAVGIGIIALYNFMRFGSITEFGYRYHIPETPQVHDALRHYGVWNLFFIPTNFYYLFFKGLDVVTKSGTNYLTYPFIRPDIWGLSIFLTSPLFLWCVKTNVKERAVKLAALTTFLLLLFILGYFGVGVRQYGYRYALDFYPFLFVILCYSFRKSMGTWAKTLIILSFLFNLFLFPLVFKASLS